jgi:hypothetical protein
VTFPKAFVLERLLNEEEPKAKIKNSASAGSRSSEVDPVVTGETERVLPAIDFFGYFFHRMEKSDKLINCKQIIVLIIYFHPLERVCNAFLS